MKREILTVLSLSAGILLQAQVYSIIENSETEVEFNSLNDVVCKEKRIITVVNEKGKNAANFYSAYNEKISSLRKFTGTVTDNHGNVIHKIKKNDLSSTEYSNELASDVYRTYYEYIPTQYPFTITYEWEEKYTDGVISLPTFFPQQEYNQEVKQATYRLIASKDMAYRYKQQNCNAEITEKTTEDGKLCLEARMNALSPIIHEPYGLQSIELFPHIHFTPVKFNFEKTTGEMKDWTTYGQWLYGLLEGRDILPATLIQELKTRTAHCTNDYEKVKVVYDYLAATTRYVSIQLGIGGLQPAPATQVHSTGFGDCKGLSNYTRAMLASLGIPSNYTVISTERKDFLPDFASNNQANHVILQVPLPNDTLWLECTNPTLPMGFIHSDIAGHNALLITPEGGILCRLPTYADSLNAQINRAQITLTPQGGAQIKAFQRNHYFQYESISQLCKLPTDKQKDYLRSTLSLVQSEISNIQYQEQKTAHPYIDITYDVQTDKYGTHTGKRMFIPLNIFRKGFTTPASTNLRTQDVAINYGYLDTDSIEIQLPDEYEIESIPLPTQQTSLFGSFHASVTQKDKTLVIVHRLYVKSGRYNKEEYANYLEFRKKVAQQYNAKIILKRKEQS